MATKTWKIIIYQEDDSTPEFTILNDHLLEAPRVGGQRIYPLDCQAESLAWEVVVGDFSDFITGDMTDGSYHMQLIGRLVEVQQNTGSGFSNIWTGRMYGMYETEGPGAYRLRFTDVRFKERNIFVYRTTDTAIFMASDNPGHPVPSPLDDWYTVDGPGTVAKDVLVNDTDGDYIQLEITTPEDDAYNEERWQIMKQDLEAGGGSEFDTQCYVDGALRTVIQISENVYGVGADPDTVLDTDGEDMSIRYLWVHYPDPGQPSVSDPFTDFRWEPSYPLPVSEGFPHHVGGDTANGQDPIQELKDLYDAKGIPYDSDTFSTYNVTTNPYGLIAHPAIPDMWMVYTEPQNLFELDAAVYASLGLLPVIDEDGNLRPRFRNLDSTIGLPAVTDDDLAFPATFEHAGDEAVTAVTVSWRRLHKDDGYPYTDDYDAAIDFGEENAFRYEHANAAVHPADYHITIPYINAFGIDLKARADIVFDRWAYGPIWMTLEGLDSLLSLQPGDWFMATLSNYPSFISGTRDLTPFTAQVIEKRIGPEGPYLRCLVGGLEDQPYAS